MSESLFAKRIFYSVFVVLLAIIVFGWWQGNGVLIATQSDRLVALARLFGLIASFSILLEVILMSRIPLFERNFSLEETVELHRLNGYVLLFMIVGHVVFVTLGYNNGADTSLWQQFLNMNTNYEDVFKATIGTVVFFCATFLTLGVVRKHLNYELWYMTHVTVYAAILLTFLHQVNTGGDFIGSIWFKAYWYVLFLVVFGLLAYYRFAKMFIHAKQYDFTVARVVREANDIYSVYITGNNLAEFTFIPGQYASWRFMTRGLWYEAHPFSFSQEPGHALLRITAKTSGDFSNKIISLQPGTRVLLDGPRGAFTARLADKPAITLIAGGIGVAPFMAKIPGFLRAHKKVTLLYSVRDSDMFAFRKELEKLSTKGLKVYAFITSTGTRIDPRVLAKTIDTNTVVFICGPEAMTSEIPGMLIELGIEKKNIVTERFGF